MFTSHPLFSQQLAADRRRELLRQADSSRLWRPLRHAHRHRRR